MNSKLKTLVAFCIVIALLIVLHVLGWVRPIERFVRNIVEPGSRVLYSWSVTIAEENFDSPDELADAYKKLKRDLTANRIDEVRLALINSENETLREQLSFFEITTSTHIGANVVGKSIDPLSSTIRIDKGTDQGIQIGDPVIAGPGVLIGQITNADETRATVRLINDKHSRVAATLINHDKSIGLLEGGFGISVNMTFIPQNELISIGDLVVTSGLSDEIPRGLLIGTIQSVEKEPYRPFQKAAIEPALELDQLLVVSIILRR